MLMMNNWVSKDKAPANYGSRGVWRGRSSTIRRPPLAENRSVPSWEKRFCESIGLIPWHKLLEAKKFMYLYENVLRWNDTAAEEAFKNAKNRFWAELNDLPCNIKFPDPDIYIDKVDWNSNIDPELLLDLEKGPDMVSKTSELEDDTVIYGKPFMLDNQPLCVDGWGNLDDVPEPPTGSAELQGWRNWNETTNTFSSNDKACQNEWDVQEDFNVSKGWNNWDEDDDDDKDNKYVSHFNRGVSGYKDSWDENSYGNNVASGGSNPWQCNLNQRHCENIYGGRGGERKHENGWGRERVHSDRWDHGHYSSGKNVAIGVNPDPPNNHWRRKGNCSYEGTVRAPEPGASFKTPMNSNGSWTSRGFKNSRGRGRKRQECPRWADRKPPSYGRWQV